jgi:hypothetical protein
VALRGDSVSRAAILEFAVASQCARWGLEGLELDVDSDIKVEDGMGSSSALRLGVGLGVASLAAGRVLTRDEQWAIAKEAVLEQRQAQGRASGYDVATQLVGGLVSISGSVEQWPTGVAQWHAGQTSLADMVRVMVGGRGAPTTPVMQDTVAWLGGRGDELATLCHKVIAALLKAAIGSTPSAWLDLMPMIGAYREFFATSPHYPQAIARALTELPGVDRDWSFKFTGAGGEDAILIFGSEEHVGPALHRMAARGWREFRGEPEAGGARIVIASSKA